MWCVSAYLDWIIFEKEDRKSWDHEMWRIFRWHSSAMQLNYKFVALAIFFILVQTKFNFLKIKIYDDYRFIIQL